MGVDLIQNVTPKYNIDDFLQRVVDILKTESIVFWIEQLDVSRSVISRKWLKGENPPKPESLMRIMEIKDISANWLFFGIGPEHLSEIDKGDEGRDAERFLRAMPKEVREYILQTMRLIPDPESSDSLPLLANTMQILIGYLTQQKSALVNSAIRKKTFEAGFDFEMRWDADGLLVNCNAAMLEAFNLQSSQIYATKYNLAVDLKDVDRFKQNMAKLAPETPSVDVRMRVEMPTGVSEWQEWRFTASFDSVGRQTELVGRGAVVPQERIRRR